MAGGTWTTQNKVRPGVYIRFGAGTGFGLTIGERGIVAICEALTWGAENTVMSIDAGMDTTAILGYPITSIPFLREMFKGTNRTNAPKKVLLYRKPATGAVKATKAVGNLTATAKYTGTRGNDITIQILANVDTSDFTVNTIVDGIIMDSQIGSVVADIVSNEWVDITGSGALTANAGAALTGGTNGTTPATADATFLTAIEPYDFDIIAYDGTDATTIAAYVTFVKRLADESGQYSQLVVANATAPDSRFVINLTSGVVLDDGTSLNPNQAVWWLAGAEAGAQYNESLTYAQYPGAVAVQTPLTNNQIISAINSGKLVLDGSNGAVRIETDINSLVTYSTDIGKVYRKNRVMRLCNSLANDIYEQFSASFIGVVTNNDAGRERFKAAIVGYMLQLQANDAIRDFNPRDVEVLPGEEIDAVVINVAFYALDAVEKIYMTVTVS